MSREGMRRERVWNVVCQAHWKGALDVDDIEERVISGEIALRHLERTDRFFRLANREPGKTISRDIIVKIMTGWSAADMRSVRRTIWKLFEAHPMLREMDVAIVELTGNGRTKVYPQRARAFSIFPEQLPVSMQVAVKDMTLGIPGAFGTVPVPSMVMTTRTKLCEFAKAVEEAGVAVDLTVEACAIYERSLVRRERVLSKKTILSSMRQLRDFARYIGANFSVLEHLATRIRIHENRSQDFIPQKEVKVLALPDYAGIFGMALDMLGKASLCQNARSAQQLRNGAVAITLFSPFPFRVADTRFHFGTDILWDGTGYRFNLTISKTQRLFSAPIIPVFGWFIDQMVLQGAGNEHLLDLRESCFARKRALFVNYDDTEPHDRCVSYLWQTFLGTGNHAARTHLHDSFGRLGARGVELAMRACDHRSEKTAEAYRTRAFQILALERAHEDLQANILDAEWEEFFGEGRWVDDLDAYPETPNDGIAAS